MPRHGLGIRVAAAAAPAAVTSGPKILPVCVRGHLIDGERVFLLAAHLAVAAVVGIADVVAHHEAAAQVGQAEIAARGRELPAVAVVGIVVGAADGLVEFGVLRLLELLPFAKGVAVGDTGSCPDFDHAQRCALNLGQGGLQRHDLRFEFGQRLRLAEVLPFVVLLADARSQRPLDVGLRIFVPLGLYRDRGLFEVHTARNGAALPVEHLPLGVFLRAQEHVALVPLRAAAREYASQQDRLVARQVADDRHHVRVGLHVVEHLAVGRKVFVRLQEEPALYLFHRQM